MKTKITDWLKICRSNPEFQEIQRACGNFVGLALITLGVPLAVIIDLIHLGNRLGERSVTEWSQSLALLAVVILFAKASRRWVQSQGFYRLVTGFFACCLVREMDLWFDIGFFHGAWAYFALAITVFAAVGAWRVKASIIPGAARFVHSRASVYIKIGLIVVLFLSRTLGSGNLLWDALGYDDSFRLIKTIIQESFELFGYLLICFGAITLHRERA